MKKVVACILMAGALAVPVISFSGQASDYFFCDLADIKENPSKYFGKSVQVWCHFDRVSDMWSRSLPDASEVVGFYVFISNKKVLPDKSYFNLMFGRQDQLPLLSTLKGDQQITIYGKCERYESPVFVGAAIRVEQIELGWNKQLTKVPVFYPANTGTFNIMINGKTYQDLVFGETYEKEGVHFAVVLSDVSPDDGEEVPAEKIEEIKSRWEKAQEN